MFTLTLAGAGEPQAALAGGGAAPTPSHPHKSSHLKGTRVGLEGTCGKFSALP